MLRALGNRIQIRDLRSRLASTLAAAVTLAVFVVGATPEARIALWIGVLSVAAAITPYALSLAREVLKGRALDRARREAAPDILGRVSHELRTPLCGIVSAAELIAANSSDEVTAKHCRTILTLSNELLQDINNLLDESKHEARALALSAVPARLRDQADLLQAALRSVADGKGIGFRVLLDPRLPEYVVTDPHHLGRVLINLAGNAVKFTDYGEVKVTMELISRAGEVATIRFSVQDTGPGIPRQFHKKIFQAFYQVDSGRQSRTGTGLGLSISQAIVQLMGGALRVDSEPGNGSLFSFEISLPVCAHPGRTAAQIVAAEPAVGMRVLIVDDYQTNLALLEALLELDRHTVHTAASGEEALELLGREEFDVLFLDYNLDDMNGERLLERYRFGCANPAPAYFLTADDSNVRRSQLQRTEALGVLTKPVRLEDLRHALAEVQALQRGAAPVVGPGGVTTRRAVLRPVPTSPIDPEAISALRALSADPDFLNNLLTGARADIVRSALELAEVLDRNDWDAAREVAHALKGVCSNIGATRVVALASSLMNVPRDEAAGKAGKIGGEIAEAVHSAIGALDTLIAAERPDVGRRIPPIT